jgi:hypothetical protein
MGTLGFKTVLKKSIPVLAIDVVGYIAILFFSKISPSGPCNPGLGLLVFIIVFLIVSGILIYYLYKAIVRLEKASLLMALIHISACGVIISIGPFINWLVGSTVLIRIF